MRTKPTIAHEPLPNTDHSVFSLTVPTEALRAMVRDTVVETLELFDWPPGRVALTEEEAAEACGVGRHVLRDLRLQGKLNFHRLGKRNLYTRKDLLESLHGFKSNQTS